MVVGEGGEGIHKDPPESVRIGQDRSGSVRISGARAQVPREWRAYVTQGLNCFLNSTLGALWNNQMGFLSIMYQTWFLLLRHFISSLLPPPSSFSSSSSSSSSSPTSLSSASPFEILLGILASLFQQLLQVLAILRD